MIKEAGVDNEQTNQALEIANNFWNRIKLKHSLKIETATFYTLIIRD